MRFLFLICHDDTFDAPESMGPDSVAWVREVGRRGARLVRGRVGPPSRGAVVQVRDGSRVVRSGPRTSESEYVAGFDVLEFDTGQQAIDAAAIHPMAAFGTIEVRPILPDNDPT